MPILKEGGGKNKFSPNRVLGTRDGVQLGTVYCTVILFLSNINPLLFFCYQCEGGKYSTLSIWCPPMNVNCRSGRGTSQNHEKYLWKSLNAFQKVRRFTPGKRGGGLQEIYKLSYYSSNMANLHIKSFLSLNNFTSRVCLMLSIVLCLWCFYLHK